MSTSPWRFRIPEMFFLGVIVTPLLASQIGNVSSYELICIWSVILCSAVTVFYFYSLSFQPLSKRRRIRSILPWIAFATPWVCMYYLPQRQQAKVTKQLNALAAEVTPYVESLRIAPLAYAAGRSSIRWPPMVLDCDLGDQNAPVLATAKLESRWYRLALGDESRRIESQAITPLPALHPESAVLIATKYEETGRRIELDNGTVPEYRVVGFVFVFDLTTREIVWRSNKLMGPPAETPSHAPGVHVYSRIDGPAIPNSVVEQVLLHDINWHR